VSFINSTFKGLQMDAFVGLVGIDSNSTLTFENIELINPRYGSLISNFPNVSFKNVTASTCRCDLVDFLVF
jgi:hypothetical protein